MKATGIVRNVDELGRFVIPKETRRMFNIETGDSVEIYTTGEGIMLKKYNPGCTICNGFHDLKVFKDQNFCADCRKELANA